VVRQLFQIIDLNEIDRKSSGQRALALGMFDGVHLGHKAVIEETIAKAKENNWISAVTTFREPPIKWILPSTQIELISTLTERLQLFKNLGVAQAVVLDFDKISGLSFENYLSEIVEKQLACKFLAFGPNHYFGKNRTGGPQELIDWAHKKEIQTSLVPLSSRQNGKIISSSLIRKLLKDGNISEANSALGHNFLIVEKVILGQNLGQKIGFPTLNFQYPDNKVQIKLGVYAARLVFKEKSFPCALNYGFGPTLKQIERPVLECHLLQHVEPNELPKLGQDAQIELVEFIRPEKKFASVDDLKKQIATDCQKILEILNKSNYLRFI
jgi:riboflavin kinase / FMN adenylyltransferase